MVHHFQFHGTSGYEFLRTFISIKNYFKKKLHFILENNLILKSFFFLRILVFVELSKGTRF